MLEIFAGWLCYALYLDGTKAKLWRALLLPSSFVSMYLGVRYSEYRVPGGGVIVWVHVCPPRSLTKRRSVARVQQDQKASPGEITHQFISQKNVGLWLNTMSLIVMLKFARKTKSYRNLHVQPRKTLLCPTFVVIFTKSVVMWRAFG